MMTALDTKLHALLLDIIDGRVRLSAVEEIKRLFAEAGWEPHTTKLIRLHQHLKELEDYWRETLPNNDKGDKLDD